MIVGRRQKAEGGEGRNLNMKEKKDGSLSNHQALRY
jgi:hypothetical protein